MSNKSGASSQIISLPKGGGALQGIGETFSPDLQTGTGNFTVPIALPAGRNGFQPQLNLVYSTGNGNGPFGLGWSLSVPGVSRKTSKGIPRYDDSADVFILSGAEDLVPVEHPTTGVTRYRPRTEGLFARILHYRDPNNDYWEVRSKDGLVSFYGTEGVAGRDPAVIAKLSDRSRVFAWKLTRTLDPFGNHIEYSYVRDPVRSDGPHEWDQLYLSDIRYADFGDPDNPEFLVHVRFIYEDRPDPFSEYRTGFEIRTIRRCTRIEIRTHADQDRLVRSYRLIYRDQREELRDRLPLNGVSLLSEIRVIGHDGEHTEELPPLEFGYTQFDPEKRDFFPLQGADLPAHSLANPDLELVDLFGNGLPDIFEMNGTVRYWRNLGDGLFDLPRPMRDAPAGLALADPGVQLIDADGDGRTDLLVTTEALSGYFPLRFGGLWDRESFRRHRFAPSFNLEDPEVRLVDLNGDGVTDAIRSGSRLECFFNDAKEGWNDTLWVERQTLEEFPDINFSDPRVKWADMSGDGLQDIVLVHDGNVEYWPNLGHGDWGKRVSMLNNPRFPYGYDPRRILVGDVDGDGLADIVYVDDTQVTLWINQSGNRWSDPIVITGTPPVSDMDAVRLVDMLGSGISGVLWTADFGALSRERLFFLDFTGGLKPYLMNEMNNHMGAVTHVEYAPSTRYFLEDQKHLETRWKTPLPFPVQVVDRVEVIDEISKGKLTTEYRYHHGYWDGAEREFRGFGRVEQLDTESFAKYDQTRPHGVDAFFAKVDRKYLSAPTLTRTWFHLGPVGDEFGDWQELDWSEEYWSGDPAVLGHTEAINRFLKTWPPTPEGRRIKRDALRTLRGSIVRTELFAFDGSDREDRPYTVTEHAYDLREESRPDSNADDRSHIFFPHVIAQRTTQWERGDEPMTQFSFTGNYDAYGQPQQQQQIACPRGWRDFERDARPGTDYLTTYAETSFVQRDDERYMVDRAATASSFQIYPRDDQPAPMVTVRQIRDRTFDGSAPRELIGQSFNYYDGDAFTGLPLRELGEFGALVRTETLVTTEAILAAAYLGDDPDAPPVPPYLVPDGAVNWPDEYPEPFRQRMPVLAGYQFHGGDAERARGYFVDSARSRFDFQTPDIANPRGLLLSSRDPLERETTIAYDDFDLLPELVTDPVGLTTAARIDYRVLQPDLVTDANGNRTAFAYTPLGLLERTGVMGKASETLGDTLAVPGTRLFYNFRAYIDHGQPISVRTSRRVHHVNEADVPLAEADETIETVEYSDGFGRLLQTRTQAEDVLFGDGIFGSSGLPADQSLPRGAAVGRQREVQDPLLTPPNVVVSGWQTYDNKGRVVEKYEPFFSEGWGYAQPADDQRGQKATMFYDPRGQVIRTVNPDGSQQRVIYGVPVSLDDPDRFLPTPWEAYTYDANDNAGRTHPDESRAYEHHWNTPASIEVDALGRTIVTIERNRERGDPLPPIDEYRTRTSYDIRGNVLTVTDALGREAFRYFYDLANRTLQTENIDAGVRRTVLDALGNEIEQRDSKGALILHAYDVLNRPIRLWARDGLGQTMTLREQIEYGDGGTPEQPEPERDANRALNRLGKLYRHYDEAGLLAFPSYDFKGNVLEKTRQVIGDEPILAIFDSPPADWQISAFRVNWQPDGTTLEDHAATLLDPTLYETSFTYDALNRMRLMRYPQDVDGGRKELRPAYNRAGALESVALDGATYVERLAYNAKGQRLLIAYGNGVMTRYTYDQQTFRLTRLCTERFSSQEELTYRSNGGLLQDFAYEYDLVGNITSITDRTPGCGVHDNSQAGLITDPALRLLASAGDALLRRFDYDPLYRLRSATGRECDNIAAPRPWPDEQRCGFNSGQHGTPNQDNAPHMTRMYTETYDYDAVGNMTTLSHRNGHAWARRFGMDGLTPAAWDEEWRRRLADWNAGIVWDDPRGNQLTHVGDDQPDIPQTHFFDANGNLIRETTSRHFEWDHSDRMRVFRTQPENAEPSVHAHYLYDASGQRVKKLVRKQNGQPVEVTTYIDGVFEHHRVTEAGVTQENNSLHVMDDKQRIALVRVGDPFSDDRTPAVKYHLGDHLGSSNAVIGGNTAAANDFINREEYFPYGETSFGSFARKRYRFTGKERDEESGLNYHGARYYAAWLGRWISCDPIFFGKTLPTEDVAPPDERYHLAIYSAFGCNPGNLVDPDGRDWRTTLIKVAFLLAAGSGNPGALSAVGRRIEELERRRAERQTERRARAIRPREPGDLEGSRRPPGRVQPRVQPEPVRPSQAPRPTPRESLPRGFPRRPQGFPPSGQQGSATVGGMIRGIGWSLIINELVGGANLILKAGTGDDLELRARHSDIFPLSPEQRAQLRQQRLESEFEEQNEITVEDSRERFERSRNEVDRARRDRREEQRAVRGTSVERARELMILRNRPAELRPDPG